jgi:hypothetical protein
MQMTFGSMTATMKSLLPKKGEVNESRLSIREEGEVTAGEETKEGPWSQNANLSAMRLAPPSISLAHHLTDDRFKTMKKE